MRKISDKIFIPTWIAALALMWYVSSIYQDNIPVGLTLLWFITMVPDFMLKYRSSANANRTIVELMAVTLIWPLVFIYKCLLVLIAIVLDVLELTWSTIMFTKYTKVLTSKLYGSTIVIKINKFIN